jgi:hypothetical protein
MYIGALNGVSEWTAPMAYGWRQSDVDARWNEIGAPLPAPLVPASMLGWFPFFSKSSPYLLTRKRASKKLADARGPTKAEKDFIEFFVKAAVDPYREQSGISKVAGGILQVAAVVVPVLGIAQAATSAANAGVALSKGNADANLATRAMAPSYAAQDEADAASADADFNAQLKLLQSLAPGSAAAALNTSPGALPLPSVKSVPAKKSLSMGEILAMLAVGGFLLWELS